MAGDAMDEGFDRQAGAGMALMPGLLQHPQVGGKAGDPQQAGGGVGHPLQVTEGLPGFRGNPRHGAEVDIAAAGAHHQPLQRRHPHRGVHAAAVTHRADRGAIAQVGDHQAALLLRQPEQRQGALGHIAVRGAVETVAAYPEILVILPRQTIEKSFRGQGLVKAGIKDRHLHHLREQPLRRGDAAETGVVMQRGQGRYLANVIDNLLANNDRLGEEVAAVGDAVANQGHAADEVALG